LAGRRVATDMKTSWAVGRGGSSPHLLQPQLTCLRTCNNPLSWNNTVAA
jgi:hypothetical protein